MESCLGFIEAVGNGGLEDNMHLKPFSSKESSENLILKQNIERLDSRIS